MEILKNLLRNFNSFQSQQFFRFEGEPEFTNVLGGVFTLIIRVLLLALLVIKLVGVFTYSKVNTIVTNINEITVVNQTLSPTNSSSPFLFALQVLLTSKNAIDTQTFLKYSKVYTQNVTNNYTFLQICTADHWSTAPSFYQEIAAISKNANSVLFCLPTNYTHQMSIDQTATLQIAYLFNCQTNCSSIPTVKVQVRPILLNTLINSQQNENYLVRYLEKKTYYPIDTGSTSFDTVLQYYMENYYILTDHSLMPWSSSTDDSGFYYPQQPITSYRPNVNPNYMFLRMFFQLNNQKQYHQRSFIKIFDAISQVGGLVPIFMIVFVWLNYYALSHFEMTFIKKLHSDQKAKEYGIFYFISKFVYSVLTLFKFNLDEWIRTREYHKMHKTVNKLIDILYLYKRLEFIERALEVLLDDHQIKVLHLMRNKTFSEAEHNVKLYQMKENLSKLVEQQKAKQPTQNFNFREISLSPNNYPNIQPPTHKPFAPQQPFASQQPFEQKHIEQPPIVLENPQSDQYLKEGGKQQTNQQEDSEYNEEVQLEQIKDLRQAYTSYQMLRREAEDSNSQYYNYISRNILKKLDNVDRRLMDDLHLLLHQHEKQSIIAKIVQTLQNKDYDVLQRSLRRGSRPNENQHNSIYSSPKVLRSSARPQRNASSAFFKPDERL